MSSARRLADGLRRSGPRTPGGKARSARNAFRHGLNLPVLADPVAACAVEALTCRIAQGVARDADANFDALAHQVAQAQVDLIRVRHMRHELLATALAHLDGGTPNPQLTDQVSDLVSKIASRLVVLNRYERRALSRRKFAIRDFDAGTKQVGPKWRNEPKIHQ